MEVKIKDGNCYVNAEWTIEDGVMVVSPKEVEEVDVIQFKDGDIIACGWSTGCRSYSWISILRGEIERITDNLFIEDYCTLNCDGTFSLENGHSDSATYVRYATEEEKKLLFDKIEAEGYEWIADERRLVKKKWIPNTKEYYYKINLEQAKIVPLKTYRSDDWLDNAYYDKGWVFRTKEECQEFCDRLNEAINSVKPQIK